MWQDVETTKDLLNFKVVADTAAELIQESGDQPVSIGISGKWGTGKSSLVKMIGKSLADKDSNGNYIFLEFNAWLYQGYEDARMALLQTVADKLIQESERRETAIDKAKEFAKRINWLRVGKLLIPAISGAFIGGTLGGPVGAFIGAAGALCKSEGMPSQEDIEQMKEAYKKLQPDLIDLIKEKESKSLPQEISELRNTFQTLLKEMNVKLVVLVDDLDRCLPDTAISTLEAMRLLLFLPHTAFIIAADEQMIRKSVRSHFSNIDIDDELVTSYFDKLIQIPLSVPRLNITDVKGYLILLLTELAEDRKEITKQARSHAEPIILEAVRKSWEGGLTRRKIEEAFGANISKISKYIELAEQLASSMVTSDKIAGNPRLIKRFLNNLIIHEAVAKAQGMTIVFDELVKLQLLERCAPPSAFDFLVKKVAEKEDGKASFMVDIEEAIEKGEAFKSPDLSWDISFVHEWLKLNPKLGETDLRPLLFLSRNNVFSLISDIELSPEGRKILEKISNQNRLVQPIIEEVKSLGETESAQILVKLKRKVRSSQWETAILIQALFIPKAFPTLANSFIDLLREIPATNRPVALIPLIREETWAHSLLKQWGSDSNSPAPVIKAINSIKG